MRSASALALAAVLAALPACSSGYIPQTRGKVAMVLQNGAPVYVRDGQIYRHGFLGSGLLRAVAGNPRAEAAAREYHDRQRDGLLVGTAGMLCSVIAAGAMAAELSGHDRFDDGEQGDEVPTAAWLALGCFVAGMGGFGYVITAEPYRYDAMNIFNDTTPSWMPAAPGQFSQLPPAPTLRMPP